MLKKKCFQVSFFFFFILLSQHEYPPPQPDCKNHMVGGVHGKRAHLSLRSQRSIVGFLLIDATRFLSLAFSRWFERIERRTELRFPRKNNVAATSEKEFEE